MSPIVALVRAAVATCPLACLSASQANGAIAAAVRDTARPAGDKQSDRLRKPQETLAFAGVRPGMIVGEFYPGGGYFTRLLSDVVGTSGHIYAVENNRWHGSIRADQALLAQCKWRNVSITAQPFGSVRFAKALDLAWVTQNYHDMKIAEEGKVDTVAFDRAVYSALKPGGVYFIIDHQGAPGMTDPEIGKLHRINRDMVVREVTSAGFKLDAEGSFLHNPADDHAKPIFDKSIRGHTDQFVLRFVKPDGSWIGKLRRIVRAMPVLLPARN